jgi:hypothetical protein
MDTCFIFINPGKYVISSIGSAFVRKLYLMIRRFLRSRFAFVGCEEEAVTSSVLAVVVVAVDEEVGPHRVRGSGVAPSGCRTKQPARLKNPLKIGKVKI